MASKIATPRYCIRHTRFKEEDGWRLVDLSVSLNGSIALTGHNVNTHRTCIDVYTNVRHSEHSDKPTITYSKQFEKYVPKGRIYHGRRVSFYPGSDTKILCGLGDKLEVINLIKGRVIKSRRIELVNHGRIKCLSIRETEIFIGFHQSNKITVYDGTDLNKIKSIILQGIQDGYYPYDITTTTDRIFVCVGDGKGGNDYKSLIFEEKNGRMLSQLTKPTNTVQWYANSVGVNMNTLGIAGVVWYDSIDYKEGENNTVVFYSLLSEENCSFHIVKVEIGVTRIRISDRGDRMITGNYMTGEVKMYDMAEVFTYSHFKGKLASTLHTDECAKLANFFKMPKDQIDVILNRNKPAENFLPALEEKGILQSRNVRRLRAAFVDLEIHPYCRYLTDIYQKTRRSRLANEDSDLTASYEVMESKLGKRSNGQQMTYENPHAQDKSEELCLNPSSGEYEILQEPSFEGSRFANEGMSDLTASFKERRSKLGKMPVGQDMTDENPHSQRWADMISRINSGGDTLKSVGSIKYSKKEKIGSGGSGSHIFGGKFEDKIVAVKKVVNENVQREPELYDLMKTKAMCNVLKILHVEEDEDFTYIVTDLCEYDLKAVIEDNENPIRTSLSPEKRVKLCVDILKGLRDLHSINVIHRDLKPRNILVAADGKAYVADFGISRNLIGETTLATALYGTVCWMAREGVQSKDNKAIYKKVSDVQVAGCLVYYVLSDGHHPFEATFPFINDTTKLTGNIEEGTYSLSHIKKYSAQCTSLLKRMLDKDMSNRPRIDDCLREMEAVRHDSRANESSWTSGGEGCTFRQYLTIEANHPEGASDATVSAPNTAYLPELAIPDEFSKLIVKISENLTRTNCVSLATYFNFSRAKIAAIKDDSQTPALDLLETMKERHKINMYDLTNLQEALAELQLNEINETLVIPYQSTIDPQTHERHKIVPQTPPP